MGRGSSKVSSGGAGSGKATKGKTTLNLTDVPKLTNQLSQLPVGTYIQRDDSDGTVIKIVKTNNSSANSQPWMVTTFLNGASTSNLSYEDSDRGVAGMLVAGNTLGEKITLKRVGL